jgi:hypothetical protein
MAVVFPTGVKAQGNIKVAFVPAIADADAPTTAEVTATGALDLSCFLTAEGFSPSVETAKGNPPRRLCTTKQYEQFGSTTYSLADLSYVVTPQGVAESNGVLAWEKLTPNTSGFFVTRYGLNAREVDFTSGQFVDVWPVTLGERLIVGDPADEFAEFMVTQSVIVTGDRTERVALGS